RFNFTNSIFDISFLRRQLLEPRIQTVERLDRAEVYDAHGLKLSSESADHGSRVLGKIDAALLLQGVLLVDAVLLEQSLGSRRSLRVGPRAVEFRLMGRVPHCAGALASCPGVLYGLGACFQG